MNKQIAEVSVEKAIARGIKVVQLSMAGPLSVFFFIAYSLINESISFLQAIFIFPITSFFFYFSIRGFLLPMWRLWAFEHVKDLKLLKEKAYAKGLWYDDDHFNSKMEFRSSAYKEKYKLLKF